MRDFRHFDTAPLDYTFNRWRAPVRNLYGGELPIDNHWVENQLDEPTAFGTAQLSRHDPYAYLKDVLGRLTTQPASRIDELLPHRWRPMVLAI